MRRIRNVTIFLLSHRHPATIIRLAGQLVSSLSAPLYAIPENLLHFFCSTMKIHKVVKACLLDMHTSMRFLVSLSGGLATVADTQAAQQS
jgi:hypothetical protein